MELDDVIAVLKKKTCLKAKDILTELPTNFKKGLTKSDLNVLLYKYENTHFQRNEDHSWQLIEKKSKQKKKRQLKNEVEVHAGTNVFQVEGCIEKMLEKKEGVHNSRSWQKQDFVIRNFEGEIMFFSAWNDVMNELQFQVEDRVTVYFRIKTKLDKGRYSIYLNAEHIVAL